MAAGREGKGPWTALGPSGFTAPGLPARWWWGSASRQRGLLWGPVGAGVIATFRIVTQSAFRLNAERNFNKKKIKK